MNKRKEIEPYWFGLVLCLEKQPVLQVCHLYQKKKQMVKMYFGQMDI